MTDQTTSEDATTAHPVIEGTADATLYRTRMAALRLASPAATDDDFRTAVNTLEGLKAITRSYAELVEVACLEYLQRNGTVESDTVRYYVGKDKTTKCRDTKAAITAILTATGGDFDKLVETLASQPIKHGAARGILGDEWSKYFDVTESDVVKVKKQDQRFIR